MTQPLVSTEWVAENNQNDSVRIFQINVDTSFDGGHIPGAIILNWETDLQDTVNRDIPAQAQFQELLRKSGVKNETHVVLYGDQHNWFATYGFWLFKLYMHKKTSLMNGGLKKWLDEGRPTTTDTTSYEPTEYVVAGVDAELRADRDHVRERLGNKKVGLVDVRSTAEYTGNVVAPPGMPETAIRAGHIPGAANIPWNQSIAEDGTFKDAEELEALYSAQGINRNMDEIITYCRIGERSSHTWFALKYLLGFKSVRNYDGSWTEWGNLIGYPVKKGNER